MCIYLMLCFVQDVYSEEMSPKSLDTLSSAELWDDSSGFTENKRNHGNLGKANAGIYFYNLKL